MLIDQASVLASDMRLFPFLRVHTELGGLWSVENETDILSISTQRSRACRERASAGSGVLIDQHSHHIQLFPFLGVVCTHSTFSGFWSLEDQAHLESAASMRNILSSSTPRSC